MPEISRFLGIIIAMYYNDHSPPGYARYGDAKAEIEIQSLTILAGKLPSRVLGLVIEWASQHQEELLMHWELARQHQQFKAIKPLE